MPEGDVVWRAARALHETFAGRDLIGVDLRWPGVAGEGLRGRRTLEVVPHGKHILHRIDGGVTIHSHLRMDGSWRIVPLARVTPRYARHPSIRAILAVGESEVAGGASVGGDSVRGGASGGAASAGGRADGRRAFGAAGGGPARLGWAAVGWDLGMLDVVPTAQESQLVGQLGPDVLGSDWDEDVAVHNLGRQPHRFIGAALLDQRNLAGLGTIYASESLFVVRLGPWVPVSQVDIESQRGVIRAAKELITRAIRSRTGRIELRVHGRSGLACVRCGRQLRIAPIGEAPMQRVLPYCPHCQGGLAPTDDGAPIAPIGANPSPPK